MTPSELSSLGALPSVANLSAFILRKTEDAANSFEEFRRKGHR